MNQKQEHQWIRSLELLILLFGVAARLRQYAFNRSLWFDEATLALNIIGRSFSALLRPLDYHQGAPIGFLWMQKSLVAVLGNNDLVLRLFPLAAGIGSLFLMRSLVASAGTSARRYTGLFAVSLFAVSGQLIYYSSEAKQYSVDVLVTLTLLVLARRCLRPQAGAGNFMLLGIAGLASMWMSHPAIFVIGGIWFGLIVNQIVEGDRKRTGAVALMIALQAACFGALYLVALRPLAANAYLLGYWQGGFMPVPPWAEPMWFSNAIEDTLAGLMELAPAPFAAALMAAGFGSLLRRRWPLAVGVAASAAGLLLASGLHKYPLSGRLVLFSAPAAYLLTGEGVWYVYRVLSRVNRPGAIVLACLAGAVLMYGPTGNSASRLLHPYTHDEIKPVMAYLQKGRAPRDSIYVYWRAVPAFTYYAPFYGVSGADFRAGSAGDITRLAYDEDSVRLAKGGQVWLVFVDRCSECKLDELLYLRRLGKLGSRVDRVRAEGAAAFLYSLRP